MALLSLEQVQAWVDKKGGGSHGVEALREWVATGKIAGPSRVYALHYLDRHDRAVAGEQQSKAQQLVERQTIAAEVAAATAKESEQRAAVSMRWAIFAGIVAFLSLVFQIVQTVRA